MVGRRGRSPRPAVTVPAWLAAWPAAWPAVWLLLVPACALAGPAIHPDVKAWMESSEPAAPDGKLGAGQRWAETLPVLPDGRLVLQAVYESAEAAEQAGTLHGGRGPEIIPDGAAGPALQLRVLPACLQALARDDRILYLGPPPMGRPSGHPPDSFRSEGLEGMRVPEYWARFARGKGVRVGIIDVGFAGYGERLGTELPADLKARSFYFNSAGNGDITGGGNPHGTACAEVVHDVAPEAGIYLANAATPSDLEHAVNWMLGEGVEVISHSVGWFLGAGDGTGIIQDIVESARLSGVLWVNAAGNSAQSHWAGAHQDADQDGWAEVDQNGGEGIRLPVVEAREEVYLYLLWDRWPLSRDLALELELVDGDDRLVATSEYEFEGFPYAYRAVSYVAPRRMEGMHARIRLNHGSPGGTWLRVIRADPGGVLAPEYRVPEGSIAMPADSPSALAAGAYDWVDTSLESFSSYGPTRAGLAKPEILGPDRVQNSIYQDGFAGTSAACPHVAGAAALLYSACIQGGFFDMRWHPAEILDLLRHEAENLSSQPPEGASGWGAARLPTEQPGAERPVLVAVGYESGPPRLRLHRVGSPGAPLEIFDVRGRLLGLVPKSSLSPSAVSSGAAAEYSPQDLKGRPLARGIYLARHPGCGASCRFYWPG